MLLVPDPAWGADRQGGLVDPIRGTAPVLSIGVAVSTDLLNGLLLDLVAVLMTHARFRLSSVGCCLELSGLGLIGVLVCLGRCARFLDSLRLCFSTLLVPCASFRRLLDSLHLGLIRLLLLVQLLKLALVEAEQDIGVMLARLGPEIAQIGPRLKADRPSQ